MTRTAAIRGVLSSLVLRASSVTHAFAQAPSPAQMLDAKLGPKFDDVSIHVPTPQELAGCKVDFVPGAIPKSGGWVLKDAKGQPIRGFFDTTGRTDASGRTRVDTWKFYKDGVEVYREFDTAGTGTPNNFRWLNTNGLKWGVGGVKQGRGFISSWRMISAEEVGYEAFQAIATQDYARLQVLFITDAEMQALKLPANRARALQTNQQQSQQRFAEVVKKVDLKGARFETVESAVPQLDTAGDGELIHYPNRQIRYGQGDKFHFLQTHEMIQVGMAWRLTEVPSLDNSGGGGNRKDDNPAYDKLLQKLAKIDEAVPSTKGILEKDAAIDAYYRERIPVVQQLIPLEKVDQREGWYKQLFDNLMTMAQNSGDKATIGLLTQLKDDVATKMPGSNLAAYGAYREMWTRYSLQMVNPPAPEVKNIQERWLRDLTEFVQKYTKAEDTPEALHQLAIGCEFDGKTEESKRWYKRLYEDFPNHHLASRARGSEARLNLVGNELKLSAPYLADPTKSLDVAQLRGKIVIVLYWGSYTEQYKDDFVRLKRVMDGAKQDVVLVCVSLDETAARARDAVAKAQAPGLHVYHATNNATGLNSPLATQYGIHILPTIFVVGRDGRVTNNNLQVGDIESELKKIQ